jgi:hypothetical protein
LPVFFGAPRVIEPSLDQLAGDAGLPPAEGWVCKWLFPSVAFLKTACEESEE